MVIEYQGKKYSVVGESDTHYICTFPWDEVEGEPIRIPKDSALKLEGLRYKMGGIKIMNEKAKFTLDELIGYVEHVNIYHKSGITETVLKELLLLKNQLDKE